MMLESTNRALNGPNTATNRAEQQSGTLISGGGGGANGMKTTCSVVRRKGDCEFPELTPLADGEHGQRMLIDEATLSHIGLRKALTASPSFCGIEACRRRVHQLSQPHRRWLQVELRRPKKR